MGQKRVWHRFVRQRAVVARLRPPHVGHVVPVPLSTIHGWWRQHTYKCSHTARNYLVKRQRVQASAPQRPCLVHNIPMQSTILCPSPLPSPATQFVKNGADSVLTQNTLVYPTQPPKNKVKTTPPEISVACFVSLQYKNTAHGVVARLQQWSATGPTIPDPKPFCDK
jgi:hypothetical protein